MRFEYGINATFYSGKTKMYGFFTRVGAERFKQDVSKWMMTLNIKELSDPFRINKY